MNAHQFFAHQGYGSRKKAAYAMGYTPGHLHKVLCKGEDATPLFVERLMRYAPVITTVDDLALSRKPDRDKRSIAFNAELPGGAAIRAE